MSRQRVLPPSYSLYGPGLQAREGEVVFTVIEDAVTCEVARVHGGGKDRRYDLWRGSDTGWEGADMSLDGAVDAVLHVLDKKARMSPLSDGTLKNIILNGVMSSYDLVLMGAIDTPLKFVNVQRRITRELGIDYDMKDTGMQGEKAIAMFLKEARTFVRYLLTPARKRHVWDEYLPGQSLSESRRALKERKATRDAMQVSK